MQPKVWLLPVLGALVLGLPTAASTTGAEPLEAEFLPLPAIDGQGPPGEPPAVETDGTGAELLDETSVEGVTAAAAELTACRPAVKVTFHGYGGRITRTETEHADFLHVHRVLHEEHRWATVQPDVGDLGLPKGLPLAADAVGEASLPIVEVTTWWAPETFAVHLVWEASYLEWEPIELTVYFTPPLGARYLADGRGELVEVCDPGISIVEVERSWSPGEYDYVCWWCGAPPEDGWRWVRLVDWEYHLATEDEERTLPREEHRYLRTCPSDVVRFLDEQLNAFKIVEEVSETLQEAAEASPPVAPEPADVVDTGLSGQPEPLGSNGVSPQGPAPTSGFSMAVLGWASVLVGTFGLAAGLARRRLH